jgi:hypothetical protein
MAPWQRPARHGARAGLFLSPSLKIRESQDDGSHGCGFRIWRSRSPRIEGKRRWGRSSDPGTLGLLFRFPNPEPDPARTLALLSLAVMVYVMRFGGCRFCYAFHSNWERVRCRRVLNLSS